MANSVEGKIYIQPISATLVTLGGNEKSRLALQLGLSVIFLPDQRALLTDKPKVQFCKNMTDR